MTGQPGQGRRPDPAASDLDVDALLALQAQRVVYRSALTVTERALPSSLDDFLR
ncbi:hypothetical protein [Microbacterium luticocti]|uniref:hypothetical protein n=1 Tax=Microbacterium luticocti TaxID=451764 RepID=UPI0004287983|nr:hypothetical protein [Microbacterium luticocti]